MVDETLQELWAIKDGLAKESAYDLDKLAVFLADKYRHQPHQEPVMGKDIEQMPRLQSHLLRPRSPASPD